MIMLYFPPNLCQNLRRDCSRHKFLRHGLYRENLYDKCMDHGVRNERKKESTRELLRHGRVSTSASGVIFSALLYTKLGNQQSALLRCRAHGFRTRQTCSTMTTSFYLIFSTSGV